jgi:ParB/RepB/Spo0J family partition protein
MAEVQQIEMSRIRPGQNDRTVFKATDLEELAASIKQDGLIQPITVRPVETDYQIVAGERRFRAVQLLGWPTIAALVTPMDDRQASRVMLLENLQRTDLDPIDEATAYQKRIESFGLTVSTLAEWASVSDSKIRGRLGLLKLIPEVQHLVRYGNMPLVYAAEMVALDKNFQLIAMRYFGQVKRPTLAEFRALCSDLLQKQTQVSMWDMSEFMSQPIEQIAASVDYRPTVTRQWVIFGVKLTLEYQTVKLPSVVNRVKAVAGGIGA